MRIDRANIEDVELSDFRGVARDVIDVIGLQDWVALCNEYGGGRIRVPSKPSNFRKAIKVCGEKTAEKICAVFAYDMIYIPALGRAKKRKRNRAICAEYDKGATVDKLVTRYKLTSNQLYIILGKKQRAILKCPACREDKSL